MLIITDIEPQKKREGYFNIHINGKYRFSLSELGLSGAGISVNQALTQAELSELQQSSLASKAYNYCLRYLGLRARSCKEISDYLVRKGFELDVIESTIKNLEQDKYLNDAEFAQIWVRNRMLLNARSPQVLRMELYKKGIEKDTVEQVLSEISQEDQDSVLEGLIQKKRRLRAYADDQKLIQFLMRRGYRYNQIKQALMVAAQNKS